MDDGIQDAVADTGATAGAKVGDDFTEALDERVRDKAQQVGEELGQGVDDGLKDEGDKGVDDFVTRTKQKTQEGAAESGEGMSKLLVAGMVTAGVIGPAAILAGLGAAAAGGVALFSKSNAAIAADYQRVGATATSVLQTAARDGAAPLNAALVGADSAVKALGPSLGSVFASGGQDVQVLATGVEGLASKALPGLAQALAQGQADVAGFANGLPALGSGIGGFFTGLTQDATTTGLGIQSFEGTAGNALSTLGHVFGSFSSAASADLLAIDPVVNTVLSTVQRLASPALVGGAVGLFGAMKLDPSISAGLGKASVGLAGLSEKLGDGTAMGEKFSGAALKSAGALSSAADVMSGPWGAAIGAGIGLVSGLAGSLIQASHASDALSLSQSGLAQAVDQDGGKAGEATAQFIAAQAAQDGLSASAKAAGVSLSTYTQAVIGNKAAQEAVTAAVEKANQATDDQAVKQDQTADATSHAAEDLKGATTTVDAQRAATNALTDANAQLLNSMHAQTQQVADAITKQDELNEATNTLANSQNILNATFAAARTALVTTAQQTASSAVGVLALGTGQDALNDSLYKSVTAYSEAASQGQAYGSVLSSLNGTVNSLLGAEASFTIALNGVATAAKANGTSLDVNNAKGAANIQTFTQLATSAQQAAVAVYQNEVNTKGASQAYTDANSKLAQEKQAFINAADAAGYNKQQVAALANQLFKLPAKVNIPIWLDTSPATAQWHRLVQQIDGSSATIQVNTSTGQIRIPGHATGGVAGGLTTLSEQGPEAVRLPSGSTVMTAADTARALGSGGLGGGGASQEPVRATASSSGNLDGELGKLFMKMLRLGKVQLRTPDGKKILVG